MQLVVAPKNPRPPPVGVDAVSSSLPGSAGTLLQSGAFQVAGR